MSIVTALFSRWIAALHSLYPPKRIRLWLSGLWNNPPPSTERVRFVLCWLKGDSSGSDTAVVEQAFSVVEGIEVQRSFRVVEAGGGADEWRPAMREQARRVLKDWNADLAIVGAVKVPGEALSLWIVPREGGFGTLASANERIYRLDYATLQSDFREDLQTQLTLWARNAAIPFVDNEARGRVLEAGLEDGVRKTAALLEGRTIGDEGRRASLHLALGNALQTLGERKSGPDSLERAVTAYEAALQVYTRERVPLQWAATQNNLGTALAVLGERESGPDRLEQAVAAYKAALQERTRARVPLDWAMTQNNLGAALLALGERENDPARLEQAVVAYEAALQELTRERVPPQWATTQNNLGAALLALGERENDPARLEQAVVAYEAALQVFIRKHMPHYWATTRKALDDALALLRERKTGSGASELRD